MSSLQRQFRRHKRAKRRESVIKRVGDQTVRCDNLRSATFDWMNRRGIFAGIEIPLALNGLPEFLIKSSNWNGADPGHKNLPLMEFFVESGLQPTRLLLSSQICDSRKERANDEHRSLEGSAETAEAGAAVFSDIFADRDGSSGSGALTSAPSLVPLVTHSYTPFW